MSPIAFRPHLEAMTPLVRRRIHVHSIGDLEIVERGMVVSDAEFAARGPTPADIVSCDIVIERETLGDERSPSTQPMRLRVPRDWLERAANACVGPEGGDRYPDGIAIGDLTLVRLAQVARGAGIEPDSRAPRWLRHTCHRIAANARDVRLPTLARAAGVHPVHLSRTFRRFFGTTITQARHSLRLRRATEAIVRSSRPIAQIAVDHAFADQSHLTRALTKATGLTPGYLRRKARTSAVRPSRGGVK